MKTLIRIVFVIFIANGIDCLGGVCDNCCDCFKGKKEEEEIKEYEEIKGNENITVKSLVNKDWYKAKEKNKENNLVLKIFKKKDDNAFQSKKNGDKISIKFEEKDNTKIACQDGKKDELNLEGKKYTFFEIKTKDENTVYLYCSDVESIGNEYNKDVIYGIFAGTTHISISVIACDTEKVTNMKKMFAICNSLTELDLKKFNTSNVTNMSGMFYWCNMLTKLDLNNFNTTKVTDMCFMFCGCSRLTKLDLSKFNTDNVTNMCYMFHSCSSLENLNLNNFNTKNVTDMSFMFYMCNSLKNLKLNNFNTEKVTYMGYMFYDCENLTELEIVEKFNTTNVKNMEGMFNYCNEYIKNKIINGVI